MNARRFLLLATLVLVVGVTGGLLGAVIGVRATREAPKPAPAVATPAIVATPVTDAARIRRAIQRALPAVVTVLADLPPETTPRGLRLESQNIGSGIVLTESGLVLTNYHVVTGAATLTVVLSTGERRAAALVADDSPFHDMAVLKVAPGGLRAATLGDSDALELGDPLIAMSSGLVTFENQVKVGVVSTTHLDFPRPGVVIEDMVQTDAAVNHGDSGGALLNSDGEVVGLITTVVRSTPDGQAVEGVALAHSMNSLRPVIDAVVKTGVNPRPRLGIERLGQQHNPVDPARPPAGVPAGLGAIIVAVERNSPAQAAGIQAGDLVIAVNGQAITGDAPFVNLLGAASPGRDVRLTVVRDGRERQIIITPRVAAPVPAPVR